MGKLENDMYVKSTKGAEVLSALELIAFMSDKAGLNTSLEVKIDPENKKQNNTEIYRSSSLVAYYDKENDKIVLQNFL